MQWRYCRLLNYCRLTAKISNWALHFSNWNFY